MPALSIPLQEGEDLGSPLGGLFEGRPVTAVVEQDEARVGDVVEDRDRDLEGHHPVVAPVDQQDWRLDAGEVGGVVVLQADRLPARLGELGRPGVRAMDVVDQLVGNEALVVDVDGEVAPDVLRARVVERPAGRPAALRGAVGRPS